LQSKADEKGYFPINFSFASGVVFGATGQIDGEIKFGNANSTAPISFSGPGKLSQQ
jgi:hypothetical protein